MDQDENDGSDGSSNKISIGEALASIRGAKKVDLPKKAGSSKPKKRQGRPTAAFWVRNLQESVQRRADFLYDSIREDPGAKSAMGRRDFYSSERFTIPLDAVSAIVEVTPGVPVPPPRPLSTFSDLTGVDVANISPEAVPRSATVRSQALADGELSSQTDQLQKLDLSGHLQDPEQQRPAPGEEMRFAPSSSFETGRWIIEEIRQAPKARAKNLKVNPLIRKMFERRED